MNSIERVAELLGPINRVSLDSSVAERSRPIDQIMAVVPDPPTASEQHVRDGEPGTLEKSALSRMEGQTPSSGVRRSDPLADAADSGRTLRISRAHLRQRGLITPTGERTANAESFRRIKRQILAKAASLGSSAPANLVMVASAVPQEGKTFCAVNLAISLALEMDRTVLLVDADVAKPTVPKMLGLDVDKGLLDVLTDRNLDLSQVLCRTDIGKLSILPAGTPHQYATELLASDAMGFLLQEMARRYSDRIIVFDSPPLLAASEASALAAQMGQILVVVEASKTSESLLKTALGRIDKTKIVGLLLNKGDDTGKNYGDYGYPG